MNLKNNNRIKKNGVYHVVFCGDTYRLIFGKLDEEQINTINKIASDLGSFIKVRKDDWYYNDTIIELFLEVIFIELGLKISDIEDEGHCYEGKFFIELEEQFDEQFSLSPVCCSCGDGGCRNCAPSFFL